MTTRQRIYNDSTRTSKYNAQKIKVDGIVFDSKAEANRYQELRILERAGQIQDLQRQVRFTLVPSQYVDGKCAERAVCYIADFVYVQDGKRIVEDVKGRKTKDYIIKRKLMLFFHKIQITEVTGK